MTSGAPAAKLATPAGPPDPEERKTIRAGVVMNGGISYAVWMGGVTQELDRARLGRQLGADGEPVSKAWFEILKLARADLVIDVLAGTSAGGLNAAALATAIAYGTSLPPAVRDLWMNEGALTREKLLLPSVPRQPAVLNGDFFRDRLKAMLDAIAASASAGLPPGTRPGPEAGDEVSLIITTSQLDAGSPSSQEHSDRAALLGAPNHLNRPTFRHRHGYEFSAGAYTASHISDFIDDPSFPTRPKLLEIANAGRASAGFPFAFKPIKWAGHRHLDGGLLDNTPFRPVMDEISARPRADAGDRWLVYVTPGSAPKPVDVGDGWSGLLSPLLTLMRETDLASDDDELSRAKDESIRGSIRPEEILSRRGFVGSNGIRVAFTTTQLATMAKNLLPAYRLCRARQYLAEYDEPIQTNLSPTAPGFPKSLSPCRKNARGESVWQWGITAAQRMARRISREGRTPGSSIDAANLAEIALNEQLLAAINDRQTAIITPLGKHGIGRSAETRALLDQAYTSIAQPMETIVDRWATARGLSRAEAWTRVLATEVLSQAVSWTASEQFPPFTLQQIAPRSQAPGSTAAWPDKLFAGRLGGFGAFLAKSFRKHDWCWGRLDGAMAIAGSLLQGCEKAAEAEAALTALRAEICETEDIVYEELLEASEQVSDLSLQEVIALAREEGEVDLKALRDAAVDYVVNDKLVPRLLRGIVSFALKQWFEGFLRKLPSPRSIHPLLRGHGS